MSPDAVAVPMAGQILAMLGVVATLGLTTRRVARAERRLGATLPVRVAHGQRASWSAIVGGRRLVVLAVVYGGTASIALVGFLFGESTLGRGMAVVLLATIGAVSALTAVEAAAIMRRPALAEDEMSLRVDDVLRAADVKALTNPGPLPAFLALNTMVLDGAVPGASLWPYPEWLMVGVLAILAVLVLDSVADMRPSSRLRPTASHVPGRGLAGGKSIT